MAAMAASYKFVFPGHGDLGQDHKQSCGLRPGRCGQVTNRRAHAHPAGADVTQLLIATRQEQLSLFSRGAGRSGVFFFYMQFKKMVTFFFLTLKTSTVLVKQNVCGGQV